MKSYRVIEELSCALVELLREKLVPDTVPNAELIDLYSPEDRGDLSVGVCLYDVSECDSMVGLGEQSGGVTKKRKPSIFLNLYYMIAISSSSDAKFRPRQEQKIIGHILETLHNNKLFPVEYMKEEIEQLPYSIKLEMQNISLDEKIKIFGNQEKAYKCSLFYRMYPVEIQSTVSKKIHRVLDMDISISEERERRY